MYRLLFFILCVLLASPGLAHAQTNAERAAVTQELLKLNDVSEEEARKLPIGYTFKDADGTRYSLNAGESFWSKSSEVINGRAAKMVKPAVVYQQCTINGTSFDCMTAFAMQKKQLQQLQKKNQELLESSKRIPQMQGQITSLQFVLVALLILMVILTVSMIRQTIQHGKQKKQLRRFENTTALQAEQPDSSPQPSAT